jgi:perosamine synthetase
MIPIAKPIIGRAERRNVQKVLKSGNLAQGPQVRKFEEEFSRIVGERDCVAVNSGTSALHVSLLALGIGVGDEVLVPSFTFAATANAVALTGATPIFVDIQPKTFNISTSDINAKITSKTRAIIAVHLFGLPADMIELSRIATTNNLLLIEDSAQAHMASINDCPVGSFGDAAIFSFYPTKNMTTSEGGICVFKNSVHTRVARLLRNQGMETRYQNEIIGFNLRMTEIEAAIGIAQLKRLPGWTDKRRSNAEFLTSNINFGILPTSPEGYKHVFHQFTMRTMQNRDKIVEDLNSRGVGTSVFYPTQVHKLPAFNVDLNLVETESATRQVFSIPVHPSLSKRDLKKIAAEVNLVMEKHG